MEASQSKLVSGEPSAKATISGDGAHTYIYRMIARGTYRQPDELGGVGDGAFPIGVMHAPNTFRARLVRCVLGPDDTTACHSAMSRVPCGELQERLELHPD
jgi:hypothetical protein